MNCRADSRKHENQGHIPEPVASTELSTVAYGGTSTEGITVNPSFKECDIGGPHIIYE
jgi:hypothetical protein